MPEAQLNREFYAHPQALVESDDIGRNTRVWAFAHVMKGARVGADCNLCDHTFIETGAVLGNNVTVKNGVSVWDGVRIKDDVFIGPNCTFTNDPNPRAYIKKGPEGLVSTHIAKGVTIGANATIRCGIDIGRYAFIGAGAVVIRAVPELALVVGNPATQMGWMCVCAHRLPLAVSGAPGELCTCPHCQQRLVRMKEGLKLL